jgi:hypothetical protein
MVNGERDQMIWRDKVAGWTNPDLAEKYGLSVRRIEMIISKARGAVSVTAADLRADFLAQLDHNRKAAQAIVDAGPAPAFSSKGDQLWARESMDSVEVTPVVDHAARLAAMREIVNIQARAAKLGGLDAAERAEVDTTVRYVVEGAEDV